MVVGIGYWGYTPHLILHPQKFGQLPVPWLISDGYIANYQHVLKALPLILVPSNWVKEMYVRDGISGDKIVVLPIGFDTNTFQPFKKDDPKVVAVREALGVKPDELMILTVTGDYLDVPGSELDDMQETIGSEDEENNLYSLGVENHDDKECNTKF